ncbi:hypothetical protein L208DRAFT_1130306, partial [Tricholoma matsutake]
PSPPQHLLDDSTIQTTINSLGNAIEVDTPFDVNKFELLLTDHPNQPFVKSVMKGLCEGFWLCDDGEWKIELSDLSGVACTDQIHVFRDKEIKANRWSGALPYSALLPGMKVLPMFVV